MKDLRALFVSSCNIDQNGHITSVSFFPPDVVQSAILAQMTKEASPVDAVSGQSTKVMELRARLAACETDEQRARLLQDLNREQNDEMTYWSST